MQINILRFAQDKPLCRELSKKSMVPRLRNPALRPSQAWHLQGVESRTPLLEKNRRENSYEVSQGSGWKQTVCALVCHGKKLPSCSRYDKEPMF